MYHRTERVRLGHRVKQLLQLLAISHIADRNRYLGTQINQLLFKLDCARSLAPTPAG